jgi:hypothetical protein
MVNQMECERKEEEAQDVGSSDDDEVIIGADVESDDDAGGVLPAEWDFDYAPGDPDYASPGEFDDTDVDMEEAREIDPI